MFVVNELKKSIQALEEANDKVKKIDNITNLDAYESATQKIVFNLQMQANQVAGELVPLIMNRRTELQKANLERIVARAKQAHENTTKKEVEDGGDSNRQPKSNAGNSKPKSTKKTK